MEDINELLTHLRWDTPKEQLEHAKERLKQLEDHELYLLVQPVDKMHWDQAAELIIAIGYPRIQPILRGLLEWIQDLNWPGAQRIAELLASIGEPLIPYIKEAFKMNDPSWHYWILTELVSDWPKDLVQELLNELKVMAQEMNFAEENDLVALNILVEKEVMSTQEATHLLTNKRDNALNELKDLTAGQIHEFNSLENERMEILNGEVSRIGNFVKENLYSVSFSCCKFCNNSFRAEHKAIT